MKIFTVAQWICLFLGFGQISADELVYRRATGDLQVIKVCEEMSFHQILEEIRLQEQLEQTPITANANNEYLLDFMEARPSYQQIMDVVSKSPARNYSAPLTAKEKSDIAFVVETLGNSSLVAIAKAKSSLEKSGEAIDHIHPLKFLTYVFTTEKLKAAAHNIRGRSWVGKSFTKGIIGSLDEETTRSNLIQFLPDFCTALKINLQEISSLAKNRKWKEFIEVLYTKIPRSETSSRYDM